MNARIPLLGLLAIQILIGYEWFMSGLTKIVRGGFPSGLGDELTEKSEGIGGWYRDYLDDVVIPNATGFGYLIELFELAVGAGLIAAAVIWLIAWERIGARGRAAALAATVIAALGGVLMNVAIHLANGSAHQWLIPGDGFDEGVDLDSLMPADTAGFVGELRSLGATRCRKTRRFLVSAESAIAELCSRCASDLQHVRLSNS